MVGVSVVLVAAATGPITSGVIAGLWTKRDDEAIAKSRHSSNTRFENNGISLKTALRTPSFGHFLTSTAEFLGGQPPVDRAMHLQPDQIPFHNQLLSYTVQYCGERNEQCDLSYGAHT